MPLLVERQWKQDIVGKGDGGSSHMLYLHAEISQPLYADHELMNQT